jgi:phosphomannomutase
MKDSIFKAYDIRGIYPNEINEEIAYKIGAAYATYLKPKRVALGRDVRLSGGKLMKAVQEGLTKAGVEVVDIGVISTDMLYFAVAEYGYDGGISITASHNPGEHNGMKMVREGSKPISLDSGLAEIRDIAEKGKFITAKNPGKITKKEILDDYVSKILSFIEIDKIKPMKIVVNPNFGAAGRALDKLAEILKLDLVKMNFNPDGSFPKGKPDPLQVENQRETAETVKKAGADFAAAWDADADRCFFFDEKGNFVPGYYTTALIAKMALKNNRQEVVVHDSRLIWATRDIILEAGGAPVMSRAGRSFVGETMRKEGAIFAGEISGHYFFREFYYCDNGMIPFLLMLEHLSETEMKMSEIVEPFFENYPISGEINFMLKDPNAKLDEVGEKYKDGEVDKTDGVSVTYDEWRFNIRPSNTEPLLRLNVEARERNILEEKVGELTSLIEE